MVAHPQRYRRVPLGRALALLAALLILAGIAALAAGYGRVSSLSPEVRFADKAPSGLSIVPASCPSNPYDSASPDGCNPPQLTFTVTPTRVASGSSATIKISAVHIKTCSITSTTSGSPDNRSYTGSAGNSWSVLAEQYPSKGLTEQTIFTAVCFGTDGPTIDVNGTRVSKQVTVNVVGKVIEI